MSFKDTIADMAEVSAGAPLQALPSICSSNPLVLQSACEFGARQHAPLVIEATSNQVNQHGGYTGMRPADFVRNLRAIAVSHGLPNSGILIGGDHLGPNPWKDQGAAAAMDEAETLIREAVHAGYRKIHIDCSMPLGAEEYGVDFDEELIAERQARLCAVAEAASREQRGGTSPVYVIGSEVPIPGGPEDTGADLEITDANNLRVTLKTAEAAFEMKELRDAWERVVAVVVQPGVEFEHDRIYDYRPEKARELSAALREVPALTYEAHSTDYQTEEGLSNLVADGFRILKVGPELTFALREALFLLEKVEEELSGFISAPPSDLEDTVIEAMLENTAYWSRYYPASEPDRRLALKYSYSDRIRYYWSLPQVAEAVRRLIDNLNSVELPPGVVAQFFPRAYAQTRKTTEAMTPTMLLRERVQHALRRYYRACGMTSS